jgi:hypothetical protein
MSKDPKNHLSWLEQLQPANEPDLQFAQWLRMLCHLKDYGVLMTSGEGVLPLVPWLLDGITMNSKLIVHVEEQNRSAEPLLKQQADLDIRFAYHFQPADEFIKDIDVHRLDMLLISEDQIEFLPQWLKLMTDSGLVVVLASEDKMEELLNSYSERYFINISNAGEALFLTAKGIQHTNKRRRGG